MIPTKSPRSHPSTRELCAGLASPEPWPSRLPVAGRRTFSTNVALGPRDSASWETDVSSSVTSCHYDKFFN
jgi:hypothetical protein